MNTYIYIHTLTYVFKALKAPLLRELKPPEGPQMRRRRTWIRLSKAMYTNIYIHTYIHIYIYIYGSVPKSQCPLGGTMPKGH